MFAKHGNNDDLTALAPSASIDWDWDGNVELDSRFEVHDANQVELKLDYAIDPSSRWTKYRTEAFIFLPKSLGISRRSYQREQFFSDTQAYIRFKTPRIPLSAIVDLEHQHSPLFRIRRVLDSPAGCQAENEDGVLGQEIRMFGCLVRANLRDTVSAVQSRLEESGAEFTSRATSVSDICTSIEMLMRELNSVCAEFRNLRPRFVGVRCPSWLRNYYEHADEFLSITVETYLTELLLLFQQRGLRGKKKYRELTDKTWQQLVRVISHEQEYRQSVGYPTSLADESGREAFVNRSSVLKKFVTSILFLNITPRREGIGIVQIGAGVAAATAMVFSLTAAFVSERMWGLNSMPFVLALVIAYVFKDRIKDWLKNYFFSKVSRWMPDRSLTIVDPENGLPVGHCRETLSYLNRSRLPAYVGRWRKAASTFARYTTGEHEVVLHYAKDVSLRGRRISNSHGRRRGINDIIRWNVSSFMARMDDPQRVVDYFDKDKNELCSTVCPKRYEINVVLVLKAAHRIVSVERFKVTLDRNGIHALTSVDLDGSNSNTAEFAPSPVASRVATA